MYEIDTKLQERQKEGRPIRVALVGAGQMGREIVCQVGLMQGMEIDIVVDLDTATCRKAFDAAGYKGGIAEAATLEQAEAAIAAGNKVITTDYRIAICASSIESVIDATGSPEMGARISLLCFNNKKNVVMMNVECDVTIGPILRQLAQNAGVVYSLSAGDEPGSIIEVYRFAKALGFKVVAAGKGKNNPLDIYATSKDPIWMEKAAQRHMNARMLVEFVDGSKTMVEMAAVSNATGLTPEIRGMHGPHCNIEDLKTVFSVKSQGGILEREGVVDYAIGNVNPGVFVVVTTDNIQLVEGLSQRDMGYGPNYLLFRPFHLCSCETPITAAQGVLYHESTGHPMDHLTSECITIAKKDLLVGETLDGIGDCCYRGSIDLHEVAAAGNMLPLGLAKGAVMVHEVKRDDVITYDDVKLNDKSVLLQLRRLQDATMEKN
jgi:predicted homoserine dehydrogenase-like protein